MEIWKEIMGYEGLYEVSNKGKVRSFHHKGRILSPGVRKSGHSFVVLCKNGETKGFMLHRLVAEAFVSNPLQKPYVLHKVPLSQGGDNSADNLYWGTQQENMKDAQEQSEVAMPAVSVVQYTKTGEEIARYSSIMEACRATGIKQTALSNCLKGLSRSSGGFIWKRQ